MRRLLLFLSILLASQGLQAATFQTWFPPRGERVWAGPGLWANRLQDWRVANGRLECIEKSANKPFRTVHLLTHRPDQEEGDFEMGVTTGRVGTGNWPSMGAATGFLIGAGGPDLDYRAAALIHHSHGPGAGIFAGVDMQGNAFFHDMEKGPIATPASGGSSARPGWKVVSVDSEEPGSPGAMAIDRNPSTVWHTEWKANKPKHPHEIVIDLGEVMNLTGISYLPRQGQTAGRIKDYELYVGLGTNWSEPAAKGTLANNNNKQIISFARRDVRFVRLVALSAHEDRPSTTIAELDVVRATVVTQPVKRIINQVALYLTALQTGPGYSLTLTVLDPQTAKVISQATLDGLAHERIAGSLGLVSHPGEGLETESFWYKDWAVGGSKLTVYPDRTGGPILSTQHTLSKGVMKMTAQMMPVGRWDGLNVRFQMLKDKYWVDVGNAPIVIPGWTATFRVANWESTKDVPYRVIYQTRINNELISYIHGGIVKKDPVEKKEIVIAGFTGNHNTRSGVERGPYEWNENGLWFPHTDIVKHVSSLEPDVLFFSGDQVYEGASPTGAVRGQGLTTQLDYMYKWYLWCWAYGDMTRNIPCITIPDDHDVFQPNLWGQGGRPAQRDHDGGYVEEPEFVKMVERTQTSHLPDPYDPTPIDQGIGVYYTDMNYGRVSIAILEDRKFKTGPNGVVPPTDTGRPDHVNNPDYDRDSVDVKGAKLLGDRQLKFLDDWAADWRGTDMKIAVSQTIFGGMATHHGAGLQYLLADFDSNGWPQTGRRKALESLRRGYTFMLGGDQHLATIVHHGIDTWDDAGWSFCVPSIANFYPRAWMPKEEREPGEWPEGMPDYTGRFKDGLGNPVTVYAATNPGEKTGVEPASLHDRMPGYGIVRMNKAKRTITMECWPRYADPKKGGKQYKGWPKTIGQLENDGRDRSALLPEITVKGIKNPVVQVRNSDTDEIVYTLRMQTTKFQPWAFEPGYYDVIVGDPDLNFIDGRQRLRAFSENDNKITFEFKKPKRR